MNELSRTQIDKLGERLKKDELTEEDLRLLDQFRQSFADSYQEVVEKIAKELDLAPTGRLAKSTGSISEKLRRESIRLTQMQDIAGCRIIVDNIQAQDQVVDAIRSLFDDVSVFDRRLKSSSGYRAVHLVVRSTRRPVEVQLRTKVQHLWAELSEKLADLFGQELKYGNGDPETLELLTMASAMVEKYESRERFVIKAHTVLTELSERDNLDVQDQEKIKAEQTYVERIKNENEELRAELLTIFQAIMLLIRKVRS